MAVVIQEFEVVPENAPAAPSGGTATPRPPAEPARHAELTRLLTRQRERRARLRAH